jgi:pectate lyase
MRSSLRSINILATIGCLYACGAEAPSHSDEPGTAGAVSSASTSGAAGAPGVSGSSSAAPGGAAGVAGASNTTSGAGGVPVSSGGAPGASGSSSSSSGAGGVARGGSAGTGSKPIPDFKFPTPSGADKKVSETMEVSELDGKMTRYVGSGDLGGSGNEEGQDPLISVKAGGTVKNLILGAPAADGIHCQGSCTIENVWWEDVGEDAITLEGSSSSNVYRITGGGARKASDKVIQHNGSGKVYVKSFLVEDFGKLYRSCGNCPSQYERHSEFDTIVANGSKGVLAGVNEKYHDSAKFVNVFADITMKICERYEGNDQGVDMSPLGSGADGTFCLYSAADIAWH